MYFYGFIEYDSMGLSWHRDFGYKWEAPHPRESNVIIITLKHETFVGGDWVKDVRQKNGEYQMKPN